ncbi:methyl-accepting chemotaxis protein [Bacterioplanoides sp.]|uniref:methyl-accepting chemotaxis protein n=1 Tax=Bacterioplanoides sp. TaxID=2066072 RepID=UPI003B5950DF
MSLNNLSVSQRLSFILVSVFISGVIFLVFQVSEYRQDLYQEKQQQLASLIETLSSQVNAIQRTSLPDEQKETLIRRVIRDARYQDNQYFFLFDRNLTMRVHPYKPQLEGKSVAQVKDARGDALFKNMLHAAQQNRIGFFEYQWPKPGADQASAKLSAVHLLSSRPWVIGTGIYIDDIDQLVQQKSWMLIGLGLVWALLMAVLGHYFVLTISRPLEQAGKCLERMAQGDLTQPCRPFKTRDLNQLSLNMNRMQQRMVELLSLVKGDSQKIVMATDQLQLSAETGEHNSDQQHKELDQLSVAMNELVQTIQVMSGSANTAAQSMNKAADAAGQGEAMMDTARQQIHQLTSKLDHSAHSVETLNSAASQIGNVAEVIASISEQTNLLALNAAIEAARAGESGRGFAVVADEVRTLAQRTGVATDEIKQVIDTIVNGTREAVSVMQSSSTETQQCAVNIDQAQQQLAAINVSVTDVKDMNIQLAASIEQQGQVTEEVNHNLLSLAQAADGHKQTARELLSSSDTLNGLADELDAQLNSFHLSRC